MTGPTVCASLEGKPAHRIELTGGGLDVSILTWGATIQRLRVHGPRGAHDAVLGFDTCEEYLRHRLYMGCVVGRFANRIAGGHFTLDGKSYRLGRNENDANHLHGGANGFSRRVWSIEDATARSVDLSLVSPDGEEGYPGTMTVRCRYSIEDERCLRIGLSAVTDAPTIVNLATHSYFNLAGGGDILGHRLAIPADTYLPTGPDKIPTGAQVSVAGSAFDFRTMRAVRPADAVPQGYDNTYVLAQADGRVRKAARLEGDRLGLDVWSTEPGVQFFDGATIKPVMGRDGALYGPYSGLCLEPQRFPDSPNHAGFTDCTLRPGEEYRQTTEYRFEVA